MARANPETLLLSAALRSGDHLTLLSSGLTSAAFISYAGEYEWVMGYISRHHKMPSKSEFKARWPEVQLWAVDNLPEYISDVRHELRRRELYGIIDSAADALSDGRDLDKEIHALQGRLSSLQQAVSGTSEMSLTEDWSGTYDDVSGRVERVRTHGMSGIPSGFDTYDDTTGGYQPGDYVVVAGRLGMGKTWAMIRSACTAIASGKRVLYCSLEQSRHQITMRTHNLLSAEYWSTPFRSFDLMRGQGFDLNDYKKFCGALPDLVKGHMVISDTSRGRVSPASIAAMVERHRPEVVLVDYLTLMERDTDDWQGVAKLSAGMKGLAERYQIPVVVAAQINRIGMGKEPPGPETIAQADSIGQDADKIVTLKKMSARVTKFRLAKNRHGRDNFMWHVRTQFDDGRYEEISGDTAMDLMQEDSERDDG